MSKDIPNIGGDRPHGRIVITYGTFDVLHQGHINLLRRAKELGDWLIVGVTTDNFDLERGKMNTRDSVMKRVQAVKETGYVDEVIIEEYKGQKIDDIQKYNVDVFAIGSDWEGYFDYLKEYCEVVYLPRTQGISSTMLREEQISVRINRDRQHSRKIRAGGEVRQRQHGQRGLQSRSGGMPEVLPGERDTDGGPDT